MRCDQLLLFFLSFFSLSQSLETKTAKQAIIAACKRNCILSRPKIKRDCESRKIMTQECKNFFCFRVQEEAKEEEEWRPVD
jgi:hypothetical protein